MKKVIIFLFACILIGKITSQIKPHYGIKLGVNLPNITASSDKSISIDAGNKYGISGGIFLELPLTRIFAISSELGYEQISTESAITFYSGGVPFYTESINVRSDYLCYVLNGTLSLKRSNVSPYISFGGKLSLFLDDKLSGSSQDISETVKIIVNENFRRLSFYTVIGAGCEFRTSPSFAFLTELNFAFPVESFFEYPSYGVNAKLYAVNFKIGLKFL